MTMWEEKLKIYDELVAKCDRFKEKGRPCHILPPTDICFHFLIKLAKLAFVFQKKFKKNISKSLTRPLYKSYNSIMHGYVLIPERMLKDLDNVAKYLDESYDYVMSLPPK